MLRIVSTTFVQSLLLLRLQQHTPNPSCFIASFYYFFYVIKMGKVSQVHNFRSLVPENHRNIPVVIHPRSQIDGYSVAVFPNTTMVCGFCGTKLKFNTIENWQGKRMKPCPGLGPGDQPQAAPPAHLLQAVPLAPQAAPQPVVPVPPAPQTVEGSTIASGSVII